mmetsp:Transcript_56519/g.132359  ORF Transcript_56519/g.132359 Transcript_56519/m.132359 type:complete len:244 (-) Transcript_56519:157-888(-)
MRWRTTASVIICPCTCARVKQQTHRTHAPLAHAPHRTLHIFSFETATLELYFAFYTFILSRIQLRTYASASVVSSSSPSPWNAGVGICTAAPPAGALLSLSRASNSFGMRSPSGSRRPSRTGVLNGAFAPSPWRSLGAGGSFSLPFPRPPGGGASLLPGDLPVSAESSRFVGVCSVRRPPGLSGAGGLIGLRLPSMLLLLLLPGFARRPVPVPGVGAGWRRRCWCSSSNAARDTAPRVWSARM